MRSEVLLRPPREAELPAASALCLRSKAHWGYDRAFLDACRDELTLTLSDLAETEVALAMSGDTMVGVAQLSVEGGVAELDKLFVEPAWIGRGVGKKLFGCSVEKALTHGAKSIRVTADPDAVAFYEKMGCKRIGEEPSDSIIGRRLPVLSRKL